MNISVDIANNDDCGNITNTVYAISFEVLNEVVLRFESSSLEGVEMFINDRIIQYKGCRVKFSHFSMWAGSMAWNRYTMPIDYGLGFLNLVSRTKDFQIFEGWSDIIDKIERLELITGKDLDLQEDFQPIVLNPNQLEIPYL
jgi:hypothetical protein